MKLKKIALSTLLAFSLITLVGCKDTSAKVNEQVTTEVAQVAEEATEAVEEVTEVEEAPVVRLGALKGPTAMGIVSMTGDEAYEFTMATQADELIGGVVAKDIDIAMVPANVASVLYNKTEGGISVIDINTLGVLYIVEQGQGIAAMTDLAGKTLYMTGKGTTPDYVLTYLLDKNGLSTDDLTIEYKSEATEVVSALAENSEAIGLLPQPFVTAACAQIEGLSVALDLTEVWDQAQEQAGSKLVTGVTIVRNDFLESNPELVNKFLEDHEKAAAFTNDNSSEAAALIEELGIVAKAAVAEKAIPKCNIVCLTGSQMKDALEGYLAVLFEQNPASVGGALPGEDFYYAK